VQRTDSARQILARTFLRRSMQMLERLSATASTESLNAALSSPSDVGGVASFLSEMAPLGVDLSTVDPFAESLAKGAIVKQELLEQSGGGLTATQVASALRITRQAVDKRRIRGTLLAVPTGSGDYVYPACQFDSDGVIPRLEDVLQSFQIEGPWTRLSVLLAPSPSLRGKSILEALKAGDVERAIAVANAVGEQGA
jgi:hypothetical protein